MHIDQLKIAGTAFDNRIKLTPEQKDQIRFLLGKGFTKVEVANKFKVNRRTLDFTIENQRVRTKAKYYYNREKHTEAVRNLRIKKRLLFDRGELQ